MRQSIIHGHAKNGDQPDLYELPITYIPSKIAHKPGKYFCQRLSSHRSLLFNKCNLMNLRNKRLLLHVLTLYDMMPNTLHANFPSQIFDRFCPIEDSQIYNTPPACWHLSGQNAKFYKMNHLLVPCTLSQEIIHDRLKPMDDRCWKAYNIHPIYQNALKNYIYQHQSNPQCRPFIQPICQPFFKFLF